MRRSLATVVMPVIYPRASITITSIGKHTTSSSNIGMANELVAPDINALKGRQIFDSNTDASSGFIKHAQKAKIKSTRNILTILFTICTPHLSGASFCTLKKIY